MSIKTRLTDSFRLKSPLIKANRRTTLPKAGVGAKHPLSARTSRAAFSEASFLPGECPPGAGEKEGSPEQPKEVLPAGPTNKAVANDNEVEDEAADDGGALADVGEEGSFSIYIA